MDIGHSPRHWQRVAALQCAQAERELTTYQDNHGRKKLLLKTKDPSAGSRHNDRRQDSLLTGSFGAQAVSGASSTHPCQHILSAT